MVYTKEVVHKYVGQWVQCHSAYGMHAGLMHRALHDGIILIHQTALMSGRPLDDADVSTGVYRAEENGADITTVQFFIPAPGLFVPYGGLFGLWPRPGFFI